MTYSIALSNAGSFALKAAPHNNSLISSVSQVAFSAISCLAASFHVAPPIIPVIFCVIIGVSVALSLFHAIEHPFSLEAHYIPISPNRLSYHNYTPIRLRAAPIPSFMPRRDAVGERGPFGYPKPQEYRTPSFRRDRVGERSSF